jgi:fluoride ion exporter CrcB/FEX
MTTELYTSGILPEQRRQSHGNDNIPPTQIEENTETESSTPTSSQQNDQQIHTPASLDDQILPLSNQISPLDNRIPPDTPPRPLLLKSRTTGDYIQHLHDQSRRRFLLENGGPQARRPSLIDDYGLDELRAPPILPDRERRNSLEQAWSRKSISRPLSFSSRLKEDFIVGCWITFLAIWGALARIGLSALSTYPGEPVFDLIWSQFIGCGIMGFMLQDKSLFPKEDRYVALYIGLTTGFCGSLTSFSSFMWGSFSALINIDPFYERGRGRNVLAFLAQIVVTLCMSIAALRFGAHVAQVLRRLLPSLRQGGKSGKALDLVGLFLGIGGWIGAGVMTALIPEWRYVLFSTVFAPIGNPLSTPLRCV